MKKIFILMLCMVFLIGTVSSYEWDNVKQYNEETKTITIKNSVLGINRLSYGQVAEIKLNTPLDYLLPIGYQPIAKMEVKTFEDYENAFKELELYNRKKGNEFTEDNKFTRDYDFKVLSYEDKVINEYTYPCSYIFNEITQEMERVFNETNKNMSCDKFISGSHIEKKEVWTKLSLYNFNKDETLTIGIFTEVKKGDKVEWIPNFFGVRIEQWAGWVQNNNVDLISYYKMDGEDTTGSGVIIDELNVQNGTNFGTDNTTGKIIYGYDFERSNTDYISFGNTDFFDRGSFMFSTWVNPKSGGDTMVLYSDAAPGNPLKYFIIGGDNKLGAFFRNDGGGTFLNINAIGDDLGTGTFRHIVFDVDEGTTWYMYVDGVKKGEGTFTNVNITATNSTLGAWDDGTPTLFLNATMDEPFFSSRNWTGAQVLDLYNAQKDGFVNGSYTNVFPSAPIVTLNFPIDNFNSSSQTIIHSGNVTSIAGITNVTLFIDGILNQTNASAINNTAYNFTTILPDGNHNWTYTSCNSVGCTTATTRDLTIDTSPIINVFSPINATNYSTSTIFFNATSSLAVDTWIVNYNGTNTTLSSINTTLEVEDGNNFNLLLYANNSASGIYGLNDTIFFSVDITPPFVNITQPFRTLPLGVSGGNFTLNITSIDGNLDACWYNYNFTNTTYTCNTNTINVTLTDQRNVTGYSNDTFGNLNLSFREWNYTIFENSQSFNDVVFEGSTETFTANITVISSGTIATVTLFYNGTLTTGTFSASGNDSILTIDFLIPSILSDENVTFLWNILLSDGQSINLTSKTQLITSINLDDCSTNPVVLYNFTVVDEGNQTLIPASNVTTELNLNLLDESRTTFIANFTKLYAGINPFAVCLNIDINDTTYLSDVIIKYEALSYSIEYYNIVGATITNTTIPINITLFDLIISDATEFKITFKGEDFVVVENALIFIDRQYISENNTFKTVELPKTDSNGQTVGHFVRNDVVYNIRVIKDNVVLANFNNIIAFCTDFTIGDCQIVLEATPESQDTFNYSEQLGIFFESVPTFNSATSVISFSFSTDDGTPKTVFLEVTRRDIFGNRTVCNNSLTSASGTLSCTAPNVSDTLFETRVFVDNQLAVNSNIIVESSDYGDIGFIAWFFLTFIFIFLFGSSKTELLIGLFISFAGAITLGITKGSIIGLGSAGIWVLVIVTLGIWKLNKENPQ